MSPGPPAAREAPNARTRVPSRPSAPRPASGADAQVSDRTCSQCSAGRRPPERHAVSGARKADREAVRRRGEPGGRGRDCAYLEPPPRRRPAAARPGAAAPPRAAGAEPAGTPRPRAPSGARGARRAGPGGCRVGAGLEPGSAEGPPSGPRRRCASERSASRLRARALRRSLPARAAAAALRTEAAGRRPRLLAARGRPLPTCGLRGRRGWRGDGRWRGDGPRRAGRGAAAQGAQAPGKSAGRV